MKNDDEKYSCGALQCNVHVICMLYIGQDILYKPIIIYKYKIGRENEFSAFSLCICSLVSGYHSVKVGKTHCIHVSYIMNNNNMLGPLTLH